MDPSPRMERITSKGIDIWIERSKDPTKLSTSTKADKIAFVSMTPPNMMREDGAPLKLIAGDGISIELSKRRSSMSFWHRNMDYDEVIICVEGKAKWTTEEGEFQLKSGEMLLIPRGVAHTASTTKDSEYMAIEIKSKLPLAVQNKSSNT